MSTIRPLVENQNRFDYAAISSALFEELGIQQKANFEAVMPVGVQQELFGGEVLKRIADHPTLAGQKEIRTLTLLRGTVSQTLVLFAQLQDERLSKTAIEFITRRFVRGQDANRYIVWLFGNRDQTRLKVVLSGREGKKVVLKALPFGVNEPYYRTYDLILSEVRDKTHALFAPEPVDFWKSLWLAFNISVVNKRFYSEIKQAFDGLVYTELATPANQSLLPDEGQRGQFAIRLIGRIIFCWFLRKKDIINRAALSAEALQKPWGNYYRYLLEPLFFDVFNTPESERKGRKIPEAVANYPFLNGGLFDCHDQDHRGKLFISDEWFQRFFSQTLERYNFTIDENSSTSAEIAIDPEMLGRIFENLLAEENPETNETARKQTGSFYTPREIVDYMVEESLADYLLGQLGGVQAAAARHADPVVKTDLFGAIPNQQFGLPLGAAPAAPTFPENFPALIDEFIHTEELPAGLVSYRKTLGEKLDAVRVLDPACGSGAFPMGILQKLVALKRLLNPQANPYDLKLNTIRNSIYGVDIQPMATELSRLRCWLSLIVDEDPKDIKALPNLDFKFVCADSLVDVPTSALSQNLTLDAEVAALEIAVAGYFAPDDYHLKETLRAEIKNRIRAITDFQDQMMSSLVKKSQIEAKAANEAKRRKLGEQIENLSREQTLWHSYPRLFSNEKVGFFNVRYFFPSVKGGFDIVIANPPYVQIQKLDEATKAGLEKQRYETYTRTGDLYQLFYEAGLKALVPGGHLCYITSNKWMRTDYGRVTRGYFATKSNVKKVIDFGMAQLFESATTYTNILRLSKDKPNPQLVLCRVGKDYQPETSLREYVAANQVETANPGEASWIAYNKSEYGLIKRIEAQGIPLKEWDIQINYGIKTGFNDAFIIDTPTRDRLVAEDPKSAEILRPILRGEDIKAYVPDWAGKWLIGSHNGVKAKGIEPVNVKRDYKAVYRWLSQFSEALEKRQDKGDHWTNLRNCAYVEEFSKPKIIYPNMTKYLPFVYDKGSFFSNDKSFILTGSSPEYLTAFLNSKIFKFAFKEYFPELLGESRELRKVFFETVPVKSASNEGWFAKKVAQIVANKQQGLSTQALENEIDQTFFDLYDLTKEDQELIRNAVTA